jgi:hypothetical protein
MLKDFLIDWAATSVLSAPSIPLQVGGRDFAIDLLFFYRGLNSLVACELKVGGFEQRRRGRGYALSRTFSSALIVEYQTQLPDKKLLQAELHEFYLQNGPNSRSLSQHGSFRNSFRYPFQKHTVSADWPAKCAQTESLPTAPVRSSTTTTTARAYPHAGMRRGHSILPNGFSVK